MRFSTSRQVAIALWSQNQIFGQLLSVWQLISPPKTHDEQCSLETLEPEGPGVILDIELLIQAMRRSSNSQQQMIEKKERFQEAETYANLERTKRSPKAKRVSNRNYPECSEIQRS